MRAAAFLPDGRLALAEEEARRLSIWDADEARRLDTWSLPRAAGEPEPRPSGLAVGPEGGLFVADRANHRVHLLDAGGRVRRSFGRFGHGPGELHSPHGLAVADGTLYVADRGNHRIARFPLEDRSRPILEPLEPLEPWGGFGSQVGALKGPTDVTAGDAGAIFVADSGNHRVQRFDREGNATAFGDRGPHPGLLAEPVGVLWRAGALYVVERANHRVQVFRFDARGEPEPAYEWGLHALRPRQGEGHLHYPEGLALDAAGERAFVCEPFQDRLQVFGPRDPAATGYATDPVRLGGTPVAHFGPPISTWGERLALFEPESQVGALYAAPIDPPILVHRFGDYGARFGRFSGATDLAFGPDGTLLVSDACQRRLSSFRFDEQAERRYDPALGHLLRAVDLDVALEAQTGTPWEVDPGAVAIDSRGGLYLVDSRARRILYLDARRRLVDVLAVEGGLGELVDLALGPREHELFAVDREGARVWAFDTRTRALSRVVVGDAAEPLRAPSGIAIDAGGGLFVSDRERARVIRFAPDGQVLSGFGSPGLGAGELYKPEGLVWWTAAERLAVVDHGNHRVQLFDREGSFAGAFGARLYVQEATR